MNLSYLGGRSVLVKESASVGAREIPCIVAAAEWGKGITLVSEEDSREIFCVNVAIDSKHLGMPAAEKFMMWTIEQIMKGSLSVDEDPLKTEYGMGQEGMGLCAFK